MSRPSAFDAAPGTPDWPSLAWEETCTSLHLWSQIVGKLRLAQTPWINHSWHVALYVTARGLTTSPIPHLGRSFEVDFDFIDHRLAIATSDGLTATMRLEAMSVANFYRKLRELLQRLALDIRINARPNEVITAIPFDEDRLHAAYDADYAHRLWRALAQADRVFKQFRSGFIGKVSPVHFFWGSFDLAVTRFSGRRAPPHPGGVPNCPDWVTREAYSHELSSCGFWPGNEAAPAPVFYAYAYPEPPGFDAALVHPAAAGYNRLLREFVLPYDAVRQSATPNATLLTFLQDSYAAAADLGAWDRAALETAGFPFAPMPAGPPPQAAKATRAAAEPCLP